MPRLPSTISFNRFSEMPSRSAARAWPRPSGLRYSSRRISPGGIAGPSQSGSLVIVLDGDFVGMAVLPPKCHPVLIVHANAVTCSLLPLESLQSASRRDRQVIHTCSSVQELELPLDHSPELTRNSPRRSAVAFSEQVRGRFIQE